MGLDIGGRLTPCLRLTQRKEGVNLRVGRETTYGKLRVNYRRLPYARNLRSTPGTSLVAIPLTSKSTTVGRVTSAAEEIRILICV